LKTRFLAVAGLYAVLLGVMTNSFLLIARSPALLFILAPLFLAVNLLAGLSATGTKNKRFRLCQHGTILLYSYYVSMFASVIFTLLLLLGVIPCSYGLFVGHLAVCFGVHFIVFVNSLLCVYFTSVQLGLKWRIVAALLGLIPLINQVVLFFVLKIVTEECLFEIEREERNLRRKEAKVCATKYPLLLVHGVFFRDSKNFNYWGRIPKELEANGAAVYYGNHHSAASVADCAAELKERILAILAETGADKVNIIAHSKGGLDCRYMLSHLGMSDRVASLTTINTPHRGCLFADYLLTKTPHLVKDKVAATYNATLKKLGDTNPDFLAAVTDLTDSRGRELDAQMHTPDGVFCQSVGSVMPKAAGGTFPMNFSYRLVDHFSGINDGLVDERSFVWGERYTLLQPTGKRGISHSDVIDLNRENIRGFDVREFYVTLVCDLKARGL